MSTFGALASLVAASAFAHHHNTELQRSRDSVAASNHNAQKPARR